MNRVIFPSFEAPVVVIRSLFHNFYWIQTQWVHRLLLLSNSQWYQTGVRLLTTKSLAGSSAIWFWQAIDSNCVFRTVAWFTHHQLRSSILMERKLWPMTEILRLHEISTKLKVTNTYNLPQVPAWSWTHGALQASTVEKFCQCLQTSVARFFPSPGDQISLPQARAGTLGFFMVFARHFYVGVCGSSGDIEYCISCIYIWLWLYVLAGLTLEHQNFKLHLPKALTCLFKYQYINSS
jgi:hypothetical protein